MAKKEKGLRKYFFSCLKCGTGGTVQAKNLDDAKKTALEYHTHFHKFCRTECTTPTLRIHRPLGANKVA